jgi:hypothetical protein
MVWAINALYIRRNMISRSPQFLLLLLLVLPPCVLGSGKPHDPDSFACTSRHFMLDDFANHPEVLSPDKQKAIQLTSNFKFQVRADKAVLSELSLPDISANVEIGWSPDSSQFFISYSDGGAVGAYHVHLYKVVGRNVSENRIPVGVEQRFKAKHWCESRGNNLFFLDWTPDSAVAFFVAEVYPTGDCGKENGLYRGYAVRVEDGELVGVYKEKQTSSLEKSCRATGLLRLGVK